MASNPHPNLTRPQPLPRKPRALTREQYETLKSAKEMLKILWKKEETGDSSVSTGVKRATGDADGKEEGPKGGGGSKLLEFEQLLAWLL